MKATVSAEAIGLHSRERDPLVRALLGNDPQQLRPWCAEITSHDPAYGYQRTFLRPRRDYSRANSAGSRGIHFWWTLETGQLYQLCSRESWTGRMHRRWLVVTDDGDTRELTQKEADQWLSDHSGSTS